MDYRQQVEGSQQFICESFIDAQRSTEQMREQLENKCLQT